MSVVEHRVHNGGLAALGERMRALDTRGVKVGFIKGRSHPQEEEGGVSCAQVAAWNVYGTVNPDGSVHTPERDFMTEGLREDRDELRRLNRINLVAVLQGKVSIERALGQLGAMAAGAMKRAIGRSKGWAVPNAPSTIEHKTRAGKVGDQPLKDTGNMQQATTWAVD